jgi:5S rRNA maturation endonuclease (ribonuclease M5)
MFDLVKQQVSLLTELEKDLGVTFRPVGEKNWKIDGGKDVESCPFCTHHDCFSVKHEEDHFESSFYKCFSCGEKGDVISWRARQKNIGPGEAAKELAREYGVRIPNNYNPIQQIFNLAADYYHNCLVETCDKAYPVLNGLTPIRYQTEVRKHKRETLDKFNVGYSDGNLVEYLDGLGLDKDIIEKSGLIGKTGKDFLPSNCFIYPHYVKGQVSHFTFKDPLKRTQYQLPKKFSLNGHQFYGQDEFSKNSLILLVEGENDRISIAESENAPAAVAMIGQISADQLEFLKTACKGKMVITVFDPDDAGDGYRKKVEGLRRYFKGLTHVLPPGGKDIDEHLTSGVPLLDLLKANKVEVSMFDKNSSAGIADALWKDINGAPEVETGVDTDIESAVKSSTEAAEKGEGSPEAEVENLILGNGAHITGPSPVVVEPQHRIPTNFIEPDDELEELHDEDLHVTQERGCYFKTTLSKDGVPKKTRISDFTIQLVNVYEDDTDDRQREIILIRSSDGFKSKPFLVNSETKVTSKLFKIVVAQYADCEWMGREPELDAVWRIVYNKYPACTIYTPSIVGRHEKQNCWIFRNILITGSGVPFEPDENGVFWPNGKTRGIKPIGVSREDELDSIPALSLGMSREETKKMLGRVIEGLTLVLKEPGAALMALGWIYSNVYSNEIFRSNGGMGSLMFWGVAGKGKSTIAKWLQSFYGLREKMASTSVQQLRNAIGFMRKAVYYASLPMFLDELRADDMSGQYLGTIRSWYDREGRVTADLTDRKKIHNQKINATLMIGGEDLPEDPATKERCIMIRVPQSDSRREEYRGNYDVMEEMSPRFSNITYFWIIDSCHVDKKEVMKEIRALDSRLVLSGCSNRISKVWAGAAYFALKLSKEYLPEYDFMEYLIRTSVEEQAQQKNDNTLARFWEHVSVIRGDDTGQLTDEHICRDSRDPTKVNLWYPAVFKAVNDSIRDPRQKFSKHALIRSIKEEPYFIEEDRRVLMGLSQTRRSVMTLDLMKSPDHLKSAVGFLEEKPEKTQEVIGVDIKK